MAAVLRNRYIAHLAESITAASATFRMSTQDEYERIHKPQNGDYVSLAGGALHVNEAFDKRIFDWVPVVFDDDEGNYEVMHIVHEADGNFYAQRGMEGTTARDWPAGTRIMVAYTKEAHEEFGEVLNLLLTTIIGRLNACEAKVTPEAIQAVVQAELAALDGTNIAA